MDRLNEYLKQISARGDERGGSGGILDLLIWCGKYATLGVTEEEARRFLENPRQPY